MRRFLFAGFVVLGLLMLPVATVWADDLPCYAGIDPKTGRHCGAPPPTAVPPPCHPDEDGCDREGGFMPLLSSCADCGVLPGCGGLSIWWGGAFGSWLLVLGVMGGIGWPLWRDRKRRALPVDRLRQRMEIGAKERARKFEE